MAVYGANSLPKSNITGSLFFPEQGNSLKEDNSRNNFPTKRTLIL
jgi:hypothetical protein